MVRHRFEGEIAGFGTTSGHRVVVGRWPCSPFGPMADVMVEAPDGVRTLLAPDPDVAGFVAATYRFDRVDVVAVQAARDPAGLHVRAGDLAIETVALTKRYGAKPALDRLDLRIARGQIHAIVGANGAGKSTLFRILLGFLPPTSGQARSIRPPRASAGGSSSASPRCSARWTAR